MDCSEFPSNYISYLRVFQYYVAYESLPGQCMVHTLFGVCLARKN